MGVVPSPEPSAPSGDHPAGARGWEPLPLIVFAVSGLLLAFFAGMASVTRTAGVTHSNDDALYMLRGDQLTHLSYREEFKIEAPRHGQYPPLWPALLALTQLLTGGSEVARFALATLLMTAALALFFDLCRRLVPQWLALALLAAAACDPFTIISGGRVMTEAAFTFGQMLSLWALERAERMRDDERARRRSLVLTGATAITGALTGSIGVTLLGASLIAWALKRRWRSAIALAAVSGVALGGWLAWTMLHHEGVIGRSYIADAALLTPADPIARSSATPSWPRSATSTIVCVCT